MLIYRFDYHVPLHEADPRTRAAYLAGLKFFRGIDNPAAWICTRCGERTPGANEIEVSYGEFVTTPQPVCATAGCWGIGTDLKPVAK